MNLPDTMSCANVQKLFKVLGGAGSVRFVGGCVRNMILGLPVNDIDMATIHLPDEVIRRLSQAKIKYVPTGIEHGTVTAILDGIGYEITTLRRDVETDGRRAVVGFTDDWKEDAARRDFTMNALYSDLKGHIYDPLGEGINDLKVCKVKFVGSPDIRIQEDYLRILRFFRFHSLYGRGAPDKKALLACGKFAPKISSLSRERITQEFTKIIMGGNPQKILSVMRDYKILPDIIGENFNPERIGLLVKFQKICGEIDKDIVLCLRLFAVLNFEFKKIKKLDKHLILNKKQISILHDIPKIKINTKRIDKLKIMEYLYFYPSNSVLGSIIFHALNHGFSTSEFKKIFNLYKDTTRPVFPISGKDLLRNGMPEGIECGKKLDELERRWIKSGFTLSREQLLN